MSGISKFEIRTGLALLVCTLLLGGCDSLLGKGGKTKGTQEIVTTPAEVKKAALDRQIKRKFENPEAHFELGRLYQNEGRWAAAEYEYNTALSFDPVHRQAQAARVKVLLKDGDTAKAGLLADIYIQQASNSALASLKLALAFQKQELDDYAFTCYQQALRLSPNSAKIHRQIGYYYLSRGNKAQAQDYLSRSFQINPNQPDVAGELGRLGVRVEIPRKTEKGTKKLDKTVNQYNKRAKL